MTNSLDFSGWTCPLPLRAYPNIVMGHGGGGKLSAELVEHLFLPAFRNEGLAALGDATLVTVGGTRLALTTDSFVVRPLFFPGGNIGHLAVNGTVNDLAMMGAQPLFLTAGFILEEGLPLDSLGVIVDAMAAAARAAGVVLAAGDTKVVDKGHGDGVFINTSGVGLVPDGVHIAPDRAQPGDVVLVSGELGLHGIAVLSVREGLEFGAPVESDCAALNGLVAAMLDVNARHPRPTRSHARGAGVHAQRDRPGLPCGHRLRRAQAAGAAGGGGGLRHAGDGPGLRGQRGQAGGDRPAGGGRSRAGGHAAPSAGRQGGHHRPGDRATPRRRGRAHGNRRQPSGGHAGRRAVAAHMLEDGQPGARWRLRVQGVVQGVGFRPFVYNLAARLGLAGFVGNDDAGVFIEVEGPAPALAEFRTALSAEAPPVAHIQAIAVTPLAPTGAHEFTIVASAERSHSTTLVAPDLCICDDCLREFFDPGDRRYRYPFINCTNCGPRFTIIRDLPYDRPRTTMAAFTMCPACAAEYGDPRNRRFHAQPNACPTCGPQVEFSWSGPATTEFQGPGAGNGLETPL